MLSRYVCLVLGQFVATGCKQRDRATVSDSDPGRRVLSPSRDTETDANVRGALASEGCTIVRQDRRGFHVRCGDAGEESAINLENFDGLVQAVPSAEARRGEAIKFIHRLMGEPMLPDTPPFEKFLLVIRQQNYVEATAERIGMNAEPFVTFPFPGNLALIAAIDTPGSTQMVHASALARWKLHEADVYTKAIENLDTRPLPANRIGSDQPDDSVAVYRLATADDENEASRLLSPKSRAAMEKVVGGRALFAIPDRRQLLAAKQGTSDQSQRCAPSPRCTPRDRSESAATFSRSTAEASCAS